MADPTENKSLTDVVKTETPTHDLPTHLPILPLSDVVVFPHMVAPLLVSNAQSIRLIDEVVAGNRLLAVTLQTDPDLEQPRPDQLRPYGCVARVMRMLKTGAPGPHDVLATLSAQERRVLALIAEGRTNKEIGNELGLAEKTVKNYLSNVFDKLHVTRRAQAAAMFAQRQP